MMLSLLVYMYQGVNEFETFKGMEEMDWYTVTNKLLHCPDIVTGNSSRKTSHIIVTEILLKELNTASIPLYYYYSCNYESSIENMK